ncbi:YHYH domain-containing protein [Candidatus Microgenomates bacterium]|nr:YHYH domain-containing protein [Candidatus Microgenomates bacterium]
MAIFRSAVLLGLAIGPSLVFAHGGGLDGYGCHNNRKQGGYHCHRGQLAGQSFVSKAEMLKELEKPHRGKSRSNVK